MSTLWETISKIFKQLFTYRYETIFTVSYNLIKWNENVKRNVSTDCDVKLHPISYCASSTYLSVFICNVIMLEFRIGNGELDMNKMLTLQFF